MPESYTQPRDLYDKLKARGCDFVTITDHNRIDGALSIADLDGVFLSEEVTTYFPEDGCKIHLLVWNLNEAQHREILKLRANIYELAGYLRSQRLAHGVAHPLLSVNGRLTVGHFEKLVLLFKVFESLNGTREPLAQEVATLCLRSLTPAKIAELADRHNLAPTHDEPWIKNLTGGSDDHGGLYMGLTWTEASGETPEAFLRSVMEGTCAPGGQAGDVMRMSTSLYHTMFTYARDRLGKTAPRGVQLLSKIAERFLAGQNPANIPFTEKLGHVADAIWSGKALDFLKPGETSLNRELAYYILDPKVSGEFDRIIAEETAPERRTFRMASKIVNDVSYRLFLQFLNRIHKGEVVEALQPLVGLLPLGAGLAPYVFSFHSMHGNRRLLEQTARGFCRKVPSSLQNTKRAWFTDTLEDVNGVARTIRAMSLSAKHAGADLTVVTSRSTLAIDDIPIRNFQPVGEFELPEYKLQKLSFPPMLEMIDYIERERFTECIISTPGPVGITALCAAKLLGLRTSGIYHTDFPQYVRILTEDDVMETLMWKFMHWFYSQLDLVYVNSEFYRTCWIDRGIDPQKLKVLPRGLDTELFNSKHRDPAYWTAKGARGTVLLYVGRISKEKELGFLADVYRELKRKNLPATLALVGEGPYREELQALLPDAIFTGILTGRELGVAYASADLFVFPSTTDTFGNVVIEALSSGLPVLVSDVGGPCELVRHADEGRVLPAGNKEVWVRTLEELVRRPIGRHESLLRAGMIQKERSWDEAFRRFWEDGLAEVPGSPSA
jgi:glycosyltransferase involved in cell wall biosynthesis